MSGDSLQERKKPRFYREPTEEEIDRDGSEIAEIHSRIRARIIGSRVLAGLIVAGIGTVGTIVELKTQSDFKPVDLLYNFGVPALFNGLAQIKVEKNLHHVEGEIPDIISNLIVKKNSEDESQPHA